MRTIDVDSASLKDAVCPVRVDQRRRFKMTSTLKFDFPVWFKATPLKHRTAKMVSGVFHETFEVIEIDASDVNAAMSLEIAGSVNEYFEITGGFFRAVGKIDSDEVTSLYKAQNSPIPCVANENYEMKELPRKKAKEAGLSMFPNLSPDQGEAHPVIRREWFSETDLGWLDRRRDVAFEYLSKLRCCDGILYEPLPEPAFVVNMVTRGAEAVAIRVEFRASDADPFSLGYPVAYFRADQQEDALAYATELASMHEVDLEHFDRRSIVIHDSTSLMFDPFPHQVLEAASLIMKVNQRNENGDRKMAEDLGAVIGTDADAWREAAPGTFDVEALSRLEDLVRDSVARNKTGAPTVLVETLLARWDERPISLSAANPSQAIGGSSLAVR
nr:hypothetical protein [Neorhizobium tomejilense]